MAITRKISGFLNKDTVQRVGYLVGLLVWLFLLKNEFHKYDKESSLGISYFWLIIIPATLLLLQAIFNHWLLWLVIFISVLTYSLYSVYYTLTNIFERSHNQVKALYWDFETAALFVMICLILILVNWTLFQLRPAKR